MQTSDEDHKFSQLACCRGWSTLVRSQAVLSSDMCEYLVLSSAADNLFAGQTAVGKISSCLTLNSISHLVNVTKDMMAWKAYTDYDSIGKWSCIESTWSMTTSNLVRKNVAINQPFANYMSHKVKNPLVLAMIWVARHLGDEPVLAVGSLPRDKQRSISQQQLLSKRQRSCSQQVGNLRVSTVYICKSYSIVSSQWARQRRWQRKRFRFYSVDAGWNLQRRWLAEKLQIGQNCSIEDV